MTSKKRMILIAVLAIVLIFAFTTTAFAASKSVSLTISDAEKTSGNVSGTSGHCSGYNSTSSDYYVKLELWSSAGSGWSMTHREVMTQGESDETPVYGYSDTALWRVKLVAQALFPGGCTASGKVYNY